MMDRGCGQTQPQRVENEWGVVTGASIVATFLLSTINEAGIPYWNCTSLCGFADRRLSCSANGMK
jgi:hypothetical protein